ncbi:hypothetical protein J0X19_11755 [Hymenobacter sp. BT186]|uniref:SGNH hydrolase-type esterase domain-containing protein n=1 Tax=Hymenobacter telluris TaxID=2816474 RepID=A0A939EWS6_9BACT|nr:GDSL-type esterase/lipase family protein [Hymenobacter telluris]MBO0358622.1 hypothetical protein [Hymenobacter telluris]MBW3374648.1 hypothetical protein [Hymenobacter norwichensis]
MSVRGVTGGSGSKGGASVVGRMGTIGDSLTGNGVGVALAGTTGYSTYVHQRGDYNWMQALLNYPFEYLVNYDGNLSPIQGHNAGIGGETSANMLARFKRDVMSYDPNVVFFRAPTNDIPPGRTANSIVANVRSMADIALAGGKTFVILSLPPRHNADGKAFTAPQELVRLDVNAKLMAYAATLPGKVFFLNCDPVLIDPATGLLRITYSYDGLHLNSSGVFAIASQVLVSWFQSVYGATRIPRTKPEAYDVTLVPYGNMLTNPVFTGTGGTISTGVSGTLPDSWRAERSLGSSVTAIASIIAMKDWNDETENFISMAYSANGTGVDGEIMRARPTATSVTAGVILNEWYVAEVEIVLDPTSSGVNPIRSPILELRDLSTDNSFARCFAAGYSYTNTQSAVIKDIFPDGSIRMVLRTWPMRARSTTGLTFYMYADMDGTVTGTRTIKWGRPKLVRLPNGPDYLTPRQTRSDLRFLDATDGPQLTSPNGSVWRLTVNDTGNIVTTQVT